MPPERSFNQFLSTSLRGTNDLLTTPSAPTTGFGSAPSRPSKNISPFERVPKKRKMASYSPQAVALPINFDKGDSVTLIVGPEKHELLVHANYIVRSSKFFKTALKKEWREGQTRTISLPNDEYEPVTDYMRFITVTSSQAL